MGDAGGEHGFHRLCAFEPFQEPGYLVAEALGRRSGIVNALAADRAGDDLHRPVCIITPLAGKNPAHATAPCWKEGGVPR